MKSINPQTLPNMVDRARIVEFTTALLERKPRFKCYGRNPEYGFDCVGVVLYVGNQLGLWDEPIRMPKYAFPPQAEFFDMFKTHCREGEWREGTIIVMKDPDGHPRHVAILNHQRENGEWKAIGIRPDMPPRFAMFNITPDIQSRVWGLFDYPNAC
jgi:hypothetical protein